MRCAAFKDEIVTERRSIKALKRPEDLRVLFQEVDPPPGLLRGDRRTLFGAVVRNPKRA